MTEEPQDDADVVKIPQNDSSVVEIPASRHKSETANGSLLRQTVGIVVLIGIAILGFGSSLGWFSFFDAEGQTADVSGTTVEDNPSLSVDTSDAPMSSAVDAAAPAPRLDSLAGPTPRSPLNANLPPLDALLPTESTQLIAESKRVAEHLVQSAPASIEAREMLARIEFEFGSVEKAGQIWSSILQQQPSFVYALRGLGDIATANGDLQEAADYFQQAADLDPGNVSRQLTLGLALKQAGELERAKEVLTGVVSKIPENGEALFELAQVNSLLEQYEDSIEAAVRALAAKLPPEDPGRVHLALARSYQRTGDSEKANEHRQAFQKLNQEKVAETESERGEYDDFASIGQDVGRYYVDMSRVYLAIGSEESAEMLLLRSSQIAPTNIDCRQALAFLSVQRGDGFGAIRWLKELRKLAPSDFSIVKEIARLYLGLEQTVQTERVLEEYLQDYPEHVEALRALASFYYQTMPTSEKTLKAVQRLTDAAPDSSSFALLASAHDALGNNDQAIAAMEKAAELDPSNESLTTALKLLRDEPIEEN